MDYGEILKDHGLQYTSRDDRLSLKCPFHNDNNPSAVLFLDSGKFHCSACDIGTVGFYRYLAKATQQTIGTVYHYLNKEYAEASKTISMLEVERLHGRIFEEQNKGLLNELYARAIDDDKIREYRLGVLKDRVMIPILNKARAVVNIRAHQPGGKTNKVVNKSGYGKPARLFPVEQLGYDRLLLTGGELKAIAATAELNRYGVGAITGTHGEGTWPADLLSQLEGYEVYVCMDIDDAGVAAAEKVCQLLQGKAESIYKVILPLDKEIYPKGDINDFIKAFPGKLVDVLRKTERWEFEPEQPYSEDVIPEATNLAVAVQADTAKKRIKFTAVASAVERSPFPLPKKVEVKCNRDAKGLCHFCRIVKACKPHEQVMEVARESPCILKLAGRADKEQPLALMEEFGIPNKCKQCSFDVQSYYNVESVQISDQLDISNRSSERTMQSAYCIGEGVELNECYEMTGRMFPHPQTQQATLLVSNYQASEDALSTYELPDPEVLNVFHPTDWTVDSIRSKLRSIYGDYEANVTRIFQRRALHLAIDLAYHSPLFISFDDSTTKGWVETLIIGDSSQGKSEAVQNLLDFYRLGERVDCKGATEAGLKGGLQKINNTWYITWGKIPTHDKRLVILEELKGASTEVISKLTDMRSTGIAELTKIEKRRAPARTRLIAISNPRDHNGHPRSIADYNYGVDSIVELIGSLEDIRRFDMCLILSKDEVDSEKLQTFRPKVEHTYTSELSRELILWCWTVKKATFENEHKIFDAAINLCRIFSDTIPIVDRGSMRLKIARLSAALAGRTFSHDADYNILVRDCHIEFIEEFLKKEYSKESFGYLEYSQDQEAQSLVSPQEVISRINSSVQFPRDFVVSTIRTERIDLNYIQDILGWDHSTARELLSFLIRHNAIHREGRTYRKNLEFTRLLKEMLINGKLKDRPDHIKEGDVF